jgi:hypothetical protein
LVSVVLQATSEALGARDFYSVGFDMPLQSGSAASATCRFSLEAQQVIATRLLRCARCDAAASIEAGQMLSEKLAAYRGQCSRRAVATGKSPDVALAEFVNPYRRRGKSKPSALAPLQRELSMSEALVQFGHDDLNAVVSAAARLTTEGTDEKPFTSWTA